MEKTLFKFIMSGCKKRPWCLLINHLSSLIMATLMVCTLILPVSAQANRFTCPSTFKDSIPRLNTQYGELVITDKAAIDLLRDQNEILEAKNFKGAERLQALKQYFEQVPATRTEVALTIANYGFAMWIGSKIFGQFMEHPEQLMSAAIAVPATFFTVDLISGIFHKFLDSYASEKNPIWGNATKSFRKHHEFPGNLNEISYMNNIGAFGTLLAPLYATTAIAAPHLAPELGSQLLLGLLLFSNGTEIHRQAHLPKANGFVRGLQKIKVFQNHKSHMQHHEKPTDSDYGIINGWSNPVTNRFWKYMDMVYWKALKKMPNNWIQTPKSIPDSVLKELAQDLSKVPQELLIMGTDKKITNFKVEEILRLWIEKYNNTESTDLKSEASGANNEKN